MSYPVKMVEIKNVKDWLQTPSSHGSCCFPGDSLSQVSFCLCSDEAEEEIVTPSPSPSPELRNRSRSSPPQESGIKRL